MSRTEKVAKVKELKERLEGADGALFADYRGLSVQDIGEVRGALLDAEAQLSVVKNTLARLAVREAGLEGLEAFLDGPTAIAFLTGDPAAGAKAVVDAAKKFPVLEVKGGLAEGRVLTADQIRELASLDSREEMLAQVAGMLGVHLSRAAYVFQAMQIKFLRTLQAYQERLSAEAPEEPQEPPAAEAPEPDEAPGEAATDDGPANQTTEPTEEQDQSQDVQEEGA